MNTEQLKDTKFTINKLSHSSDYYNSVFKKTEKLVSVTFYILSFIERTPQSIVHIDAITTRGLHLYETVLASLAIAEFDAPERLFTLQQSLVGLQGSFKIAEAARVLTPELLVVLEEPLDLLVRYLRNHYFTRAGEVVDGNKVRGESPREGRLAGAAPRPRVPSRVVIPKGDISSDAHLVYSQLTDRSERIKTVLEAKPDATIKDIAEVITDVSEKTIQRELNSLIEKGQVSRTGERRWSRYSVSK